MSDRATWIRDFFFTEGAPLLYDINFMPKPAYFAAQDVLRQVAAANPDSREPQMNTDEHR
jgi:GH35 family endo-1,4-beta-xylanase